MKLSSPKTPFSLYGEIVRDLDHKIDVFVNRLHSEPQQINNVRLCNFGIQVLIVDEWHTLSADLDTITNNLADDFYIKKDKEKKKNKTKALTPKKK